MINRPKRNIGPHVGIVKLNIFIHRLLPDGSIDPEHIDCSDDFKDNNMTTQAQLTVKGFDRWDCVQKVKKLLEGLSNGK
jgi:hypothetical protein